MIRKPFLFICTVLLIASCTESDISVMYLSDFNIDNTTIVDKSEVEVIQFSGGYDQEAEVTHYVHFIGVTKETNDTINVLTLSPSMILADEDRTLKLAIQGSPTYSTFLSTMDGMSLETIGKITSVWVDPKFEAETQNSYPTVVGIFYKTVQNP